MHMTLMQIKQKQCEYENKALFTGKKLSFSIEPGGTFRENLPCTLALYKQRLTVYCEKEIVIQPLLLY